MNPVLNKKFFIDSRQRLMDSISGGLIVISGYTLQQRAGDSSFSFQQESNFWYLTGIDEPNWWVIIDGVRGRSWLVAPHVDEVHRTFEGGLSSDDAIKISGVNEVIDYDKAISLLHQLAHKHSIVRTIGEHPYREHFNFTENPSQKRLTTVLERTFNSIQDCRSELSRLRAIKRPEEITVMKKAIRSTTDAFALVKERLSGLKYEYEVEAEFDYAFKRRGLRHAYDPIIAGSSNACTLHYDKNRDRLKKNSLLLLDVGASSEGYSADISRTYAIGTPTKRQVAVHSAVEQSHKQIIKLIKPGVSIREYDREVDRIMKTALIGLGLLVDHEDPDYRKYFPHAISHGLGIDTHDSLGGPEVFLEGMVLTVEPGIYIESESIGVRIEDDILVTKTGNSNLSGHLSTALI